MAGTKTTRPKTRAPVGALGPVTTPKGVYLAYVDGAWREARSGGVHDNLDPASRRTVFGRVPECSKDEVEEAVRAAERDFDAWRLLSGDFRTKVLFRLAETLRRNEDGFMRLMTREMGKTLFDSRLDWLEAVGVCEALAPQGANMKGVTYPKLQDGVAMESRLAPRGVAAIVTPFNFPLAIPLAQVAAALVTGNTVVWKPSHLVPECSQALALAMIEALEGEAARQKATVPRGVFHMVLGDAVTGDALVRAPEVRTISFTGSKRVGDRVDSIASALGKKVMKEVAGINVFYVHADADLDRAARNFLYGKTITGGQRCSSIQEVLVDAAVHDEFLKRAVALAKNVVQGPGASAELTEADRSGGRAFSLPPLVSEEQLRRLETLVADSVAAGARVLYQGKVPPKLAAEGNYYPLTLVGDVTPGVPLHSEEAFGPVGVITKVSGVEEAIRIANEKVGIVACIDSRDKSVTENFIERVLRTRIDDGRHGTGAFWGTKFGGDRGAGSGNPALDEDMAFGYCIWKTIYRAYKPLAVLLVTLVALSRPLAAQEPGKSAPEPRWFKGNTHTHTLNSDGDSSPGEVAHWYRDHGYDFLVLSDHNYFTVVDEIQHEFERETARRSEEEEKKGKKPTAKPFLLIPGEEVTDEFEKASIHVNALGSIRVVGAQKGASKRETLQRDIDAIHAAGGAPSVNHPNYVWSLTADDLAAMKGLKHFEIWNGHPDVHNVGGGGVPSCEDLWDDLLSRDVRLWGVAVDDAHSFQTWGPRESNPGRGWIVVRARELTRAAVRASFESGDFYASTGVVLADMRAEGRTLRVRIEPDEDAKFTTFFVGERGKLLKRDGALESSYALAPAERYVRARVVSSRGEMAWTQPLFGR